MYLQVRLPSDVSDEVDEDPSGSKAIWERGLLSGASQKVCVCERVCMCTVSLKVPLSSHTHTHRHS